MKALTRKSKLLRNIGANAYGQIITVFIQIISIPLYVHYWGVGLYGEWLILSAIPAYLSLSDIGLATVAANDMTMRVAKGDRQGALNVYQSISIVIVVLAVIVGSILGGLVFNLPIESILRLGHVHTGQVATILFTLILSVFVNMQIGVFLAGFRAVDLYAHGTMLNNTSRLIEWGVGIFILTLGGGLIAVAVATLITRIFGAFVIWFLLRKHAKWLCLGMQSASIGVVRILLKPAFAFMAFPLGLALSLQGTLLVIGFLLGPVAVALFATYRTLTRVLVQLIAVINHAVWPEISAAYGAGKIDSVLRLYRKSSSITFWASLLSVFMLGLTGEVIINIWTHHVFEQNSVLLILLLTTAFVNVLWQANYVLLMATNTHQNISIAFVVTSAAALIACFILIPIFGINGAGFALLFAEIPMFYLAISSGLSLLNDNWLSYAKAVIDNPFNRKLKS